MLSSYRDNNQRFYPTYAEIDLKALAHNLEVLRSLATKNTFDLPNRNDGLLQTKNPKVLAVIKADAYGHGMKEVGTKLQELGVDYFAVSDVAEGIYLRDSGIEKPILLFESTLEEDIDDIIKYKLMPTVCTFEFAKKLDQKALQMNTQIDIHIEIDTGMGRLGVWHEDAFDFVKTIFQDCQQLVVHGIYTHFPTADTDKEFTDRQISILHDLVLQLDKAAMVIPFIHAANSMGVVGYKTHVLNLIRPGLMLYGLSPDKNKDESLNLKPVMSIKSHVLYVKDIEKGRGLSYGHKFIAPHAMRVATIPIGYNDGYMRNFSNKTYVLINGIRCAVLGVVTMDQIIVDVSSVKDVAVGDAVTILGVDKKQHVSADFLAEFGQTINYEIVCSLGNRLPRTFV